MQARQQQLAELQRVREEELRAARTQEVPEMSLGILRIAKGSKRCTYLWLLLHIGVLGFVGVLIVGALFIWVFIGPLVFETPWFLKLPYVHMYIHVHMQG